MLNLKWTWVYHTNINVYSVFIKDGILTFVAHKVESHVPIIYYVLCQVNLFLREENPSAWLTYYLRTHKNFPEVHHKFVWLWSQVRNYYNWWMNFYIYCWSLLSLFQIKVTICLRPNTFRYIYFWSDNFFCTDIVRVLLYKFCNLIENVIEHSHRLLLHE